MVGGSFLSSVIYVPDKKQSNRAAIPNTTYWHRFKYNAQNEKGV